MYATPVFLAFAAVSSLIVFQWPIATSSIRQGHSVSWTECSLLYPLTDTESHAVAL